MRLSNIIFITANVTLVFIAYLQYKAIDSNLSEVSKVVTDVKTKFDKIF